MGASLNLIIRLEEIMEEDIYFTTVIDQIDAYERFESLVAFIQTKPEIIGSLTQDQTNSIQKVLADSQKIKQESKVESK